MPAIDVRAVLLVFTSALLLGVTFLALRTLLWSALVSVVASWPIFTLFLALRTVKPPGFGTWVVTAAIGLGIGIPCVLVMRRVRNRARGGMSQPVSETSCDEATIATSETSHPVHVHLVPGTWAHGYLASFLSPRGTRKPFWFEEGSEFRCKLVEGLQARGKVSFSTLRWSERNSLQARSKAAADFARHLKSSLDTDAQSVHVIVAHSHGGNVALSAYQTLDASEQHRIRGIVTMGTPFLWFEPRETGRVAQGLLFIVRLVLPVYVGLARVGGSFLLLFFPLIVFRALPGWLFPWPGLITWLVAGVALGLVEWQKNEETFQVALAARASTKDDNLPPLFVLRSPDDEASRGMRAGQTSARLLVLAWTAFNAFFERGRPWWRIGLIIGASLVVGTVGVTGWPIPSFDSVVGAFRNPVTILFQGFATLYVAVAVAFVGIGLVAAMPLAIALGPELLRIPLVVSPVVEDMPAGIPISAMNLPGTGFRHQVYSRPEAAAQVATFIRNISVADVAPAAKAS